MLREKGHVLAPIAQRGQRDGHHVQPVEKVLAEPPGLHLRRQILVGRRDDAGVYLHGSRLTDPADLAFLEDPQELSLDARPDVADLVEKERSRARLFEETAPRSGRSGERSSRVPE